MCLDIADSANICFCFFADLAVICIHVVLMCFCWLGNKLHTLVFMLPILHYSKGCDSLRTCTNCIPSGMCINYFANSG